MPIKVIMGHWIVNMSSSQQSTCLFRMPICSQDSPWETLHPIQKLFSDPRSSKHVDRKGDMLPRHFNFQNFYENTSMDGCLFLILSN